MDMAFELTGKSNEVNLVVGYAGKDEDAKDDF